MPLDHFQLSCRNAGLILLGKKNPSMYTSDMFAPPYDEIHEYMIEHPEWALEDLYQQFPASELDAAKHDAGSLNGSSTDVDWASALRKAQSYWDLGDRLKHVGVDLQKGIVPDLLPVAADLRALSTNSSTGLRLSKDVDWQSVTELHKSGWDVLDVTIGGIATSGPIVVVAPTKTGKTFFTGKLISKYLNFYPEKKAAIFTLELTDKRYLSRVFSVYPELNKPHEEGRLYITHRCRNITDIMNAVSTENCDIVVIDGIDGLVKGQFDTSKFAAAWAGLVEMGVLLEIPIIVTAQPNREGKFNAQNKFLGKYSVEWSGAAENNCEQLLALQYIRDEMDMDDETFHAYDNSYYIISWLQREGWKTAQEGPGAIILREHNGVPWNGPALDNYLWSPGSGAVGRKKKKY